MSPTSDATHRPKDWHMSDLHSIIISKHADKDEKCEAYTKWAPSFDADVLEQGYTSPGIVAEKLFRLSESKQVSVLDIGCGTGLLAPAVVEVAKREGLQLHFDGLDYCQAMLDVARKKNVYRDLVRGDITKPMRVPDELYDFLIAGGVFVEGHTGPEVIPNLVTCLKSGGYCIFTVREKTFDNAEAEYRAAFEKADCTLIENQLLHYLGPVHAYYTVLRKN